MRRFIATLLFVFIAAVLTAQVDCRPYIPTSTGSIWEITSYSAKGKETGKTTYELVDKVEDGNDITFTINTVSYDKKGKEIFSSSYDAQCVNGNFELDMAYKLEGGTMQAYQNMDMELDASEFEIPSMDAAVGTALADGSLTVNMTGALGLTMTVNITDRKVEGKTSYTTPAGDFDCLVLTQNISTKLIVGIKVSSKEWYAEGIGMVRSESYNKKGKMMGYSELTKVEIK